MHEGFRYNTTLRNGSSEGRIYELTAAVPDGWNVVFRARGSQLASINLDGNKDENISVEVHPAFIVEPAKYKIACDCCGSRRYVTAHAGSCCKGSLWNRN